MTSLLLEKTRKIERQVVKSMVTKILVLLFLLFCFFVSVDLMVISIRAVVNEVNKDFINAVSNPFIGLFVGLLVTSISQSSSATTSVVVAIVASGAISLQNAVPIIMGANVGTTITSTIVALGHLQKKKEFQRAIAAGTLHDFFNILSVFLLFPLEYYFHILSDTSLFLTSFLPITESNLGANQNFIKSISNSVMDLMGNNGYLLLFISLILLFSSLRVLVYMLKSIWIIRLQTDFSEKLFGATMKAFAFGGIFTATIQSSSVTTSFAVPLVATQKVSLEKVFPFIIGANIGTTITALLVALSKTEAAVAIALCHFLFNVFGGLLIYPIPIIRQIPIRLANFIGQSTMQNRLLGFLYIAFTFFILPFLLIFGSLKMKHLGGSFQKTHIIHNTNNK